MNTEKSELQDLCEPPERYSTPTCNSNQVYYKDFWGEERMFISIQVAPPERFLNSSSQTQI